MNFILENAGSLAVVIFLAVILFFAVKSVIKNRKKGCVGCNKNCFGNCDKK